LAQGVAVSAFGIAGLVSASLHPHAGPTGAPVLGLALTSAHSATLLAFGLAAVSAVGNRRAAVTVAAVSAVAYTMLLFFGSVATARTKPTPLGFHAADIVLHGVLAVVNLALLMWLIPDELGDEAWVPRRRRGGRDRRQSPAAEAFAEPAAPSPNKASAMEPASPHAETALAPPPLSVEGHPGQPESTNPTVGIRPAPRGLIEQSESRAANEPSAHGVENSTQPKHFAAQATNGALPRGVAPLVVAVLAAVVGIVIWIRRR
jgi:hypothetical protein